MARGGPSWLRVRRRRKAARRAETFIAEYEFPPHVSRRVKRKLGLDDLGWLQVERGLREWFVCCAWRGTRMVGMPSRAVDEAWHEFILDSVAYSQFCEAAFGEYLHHTPDEAMPGAGAELPDLNAETVRAWDRSRMGAGGDSTLWDLDARLGLAAPLGVAAVAVEAARTRSPYPLATGWACGGVFLGGDGGFGGEGGSGEGDGGSGESGGDSGGGGDGGGGGGGGGGDSGGGSSCSGGGGCGGGS